MKKIKFLFLNGLIGSAIFFYFVRKIQNYYNKMLQNQTIMKVRKIQNERKTV